MLRKSSLAMAVAWTLGPASCWALSLGSLETHSALNQRFDAVIPVRDLDPADIDGIKAGIASAADFARAGLDRPYLLQRLRFNPTVTPDGRTVIRVTSQGAIREPFLDFLVEVVWPKGRLLKEYTVLLDPPVTTGRQSPPLEAPRTAAGKLARGAVTVAAASPAVKAPGGGVGQARVYGPVRPGQTLWSIAKGLNVRGATTTQVALALFRENRDAFVGGDINRLRVGARLRVPQAVTAIPAGKARREFLDLIRAQGRSKTGPHPGSPAKRAELHIVTPSKKKAPEEGAIEQVKSDLMIVREAGESTRQETQDLRNRIQELEAQLADIRRLLALKNDQLARLASGKRTSPSAPESVSERPPAVVPPVVGEADVATEPPPPAAPPTESAGRQVPTPLQGPPAQAASPEATAPVAAVQPESPTAPPHPVAPEVEPAASVTPPEPGILDRLLGDTTLLGVVGAFAVVMLALIWLFVRRRREAEIQLQESMLIHPEAMTRSGGGADPDAPEARAGLKEVDETSFMSDFTPSDIDALHEETGEVDPASEADVYIAYGRYQQAESLIAQALEKQPERVDLKLKLLEIYFTTRNTAAFVKLAEEMGAQGVANSEPEAWKKVVEMGRELLPSHRLFGGQRTPEPAAASTRPAAAAVAGDRVAPDTTALPTALDIEAEVSELPSVGTQSGTVQDEGEASVGGSSKEAKSGDLMDEPPSGPPKTLQSPSELDIDLDDLASLDDIDLGDIDLDRLSESTDATPTQETHPSTTGLESGSPAVSSAPRAQSSDAVSEVPDIDLSDLEMGETDVVSKAEVGSLSDLLQPVSEHVETDAGSPSAADSAGARDNQEEIETKLDLARAYLEMGDSEGAKEILVEVAEEGNAQQRDQARDLLEDLG